MYDVVASTREKSFLCVCDVVYNSPEYEEDSEEESGKDWDELEEEAREG